MVLPIHELWLSRDQAVWADALERYWGFIQPRNLELERAMERLDRERIRRLGPEEWFRFLRDEYFPWKYTARNRYATTTAHLQRSASVPGGLESLLAIKDRLVAIDPSDVASALGIALAIPGLGTAGASGLLALLYPDALATVDQFVVKALRGVRDLPEAAALGAMNPEGLRVRDAVLLVGIMRRQSRELNASFGTESWTPRAVDKVLWTYGRA